MNKTMQLLDFINLIVDDLGTHKFNLSIAKRHESHDYKNSPAVWVSWADRLKPLRRYLWL